MNWLTHPQMLALQRQLLGTTADRLYFDHSQLLTRTKYPGGQWHSHGCGHPYDDCGPCTSLEEYDAQPNTILNLICKRWRFLHQLLSNRSLANPTAHHHQTPKVSKGTGRTAG